MANLMPSKHLVYFEVFEALQDQGCPVCRLGLRAVSRQLDALSYEGVNDPRTREELRGARGFCHRHAWQFANDVRDGLGTAIIYRDVVGEVLRILNAGAGERRLTLGRPAPRPSLEALAARLGPQQECPACRLLAESSRRYLDTLLSHLGDQAFRARYLASDGLCLPHLSLALRHLADERHRSFLARAFARRMASLAAAPGPEPALRAAAILESLVGKEEAAPQPEPQPPHEAQPGDESGVLEPPSLAEASGEAACPVCLSVAPAMERWLARLAQSPEAFAPGAGMPSMASLCNAHAWRLLRIAQGSDLVASLQPLALAAAGLVEERARQARGEAGWWRAFASLARRRQRRPGATGLVLGEKHQCPACAAQATMEQRATLAALAAAGREVAVGQGAAMPQLCLPHLRMAIGASRPGPEVKALATAHVGALVALRWQLDEYIRKQDYRFRHEPLGAEADAPWRAIALLAGSRQV